MMYFHIHMGSPLSNFDKHLYKPRRPISKVLSPSESRLKVCLQCASPVHGPEVVVCHSHHHELASVRPEAGSPSRLQLKLGQTHLIFLNAQIEAKGRSGDLL